MCLKCKQNKDENSEIKQTGELLHNRKTGRLNGYKRGFLSEVVIASLIAISQGSEETNNEIQNMCSKALKEGICCIWYLVLFLYNFFVYISDWRLFIILELHWMLNDLINK